MLTTDRDRRTDRPIDDVTPPSLDEKHYRAVDQLCEEIEKVLERRPGDDLELNHVEQGWTTRISRQARKMIWIYGRAKIAKFYWVFL